MANDTNTTLTFAFDDAVLGLALVFCIMLLAVGFKDKSFWLLAGPVWIFCGIAIFFDYGALFMIMSVGLGMFLLIQGAMAYA